MVVQVQEFRDYTPQAVEVAPPPHKVVPPAQNMICPRCEAQLRINFDEPQCLQCGYVDYGYVPPQKKERKDPFNGNRHILRYTGEFKNLKDTLTHVELRRFRNRAIYLVCCPFCNKEMTQTSLSGKRREVREERYKCAQDHRISLTPSKNGSLGWK